MDQKPRPQVVVIITDSERQCSQCRDTGLIRQPNERGGITVSRCGYCLAFDRRGLGGDYDLEPRLPSLFGSAA